MNKNEYLMENDEEALRLELKTDEASLRRQALWGGIGPGMRVADIGCGCGVTSSMLHNLTQPGGKVVGIDASEPRIEYAGNRYGNKAIDFHRRNMLKPLDDLGEFDFVWVRFVLEYFLADGFAVVENVSRIVKPGGTLCLIDLDHNCLSHFAIPPRLERTLFDIMRALQEKADFDPYAGRKLYSFLYDLGYRDIDVAVSAHHLIFGELRESDSFNWLKKVETAPRKIGYTFPEYQGGYEEFLEEFQGFFNDPRRFTYSPIISCRGRKPIA
ncbi:MAG: class I SAM-dependent methyltransferase [Deltaproteobacteria bacterium]|nr:class I SAM-dependent methyltransferase [Deltaproteobacteria bacterium]